MALCLLFLEDNAKGDKRNGRDGRGRGMRRREGKGKEEFRDL